MNIEIKVDDITLSTVVAEVMSYDEDGDLVPDGKEKTVADLVADRIVASVVRDDRYPRLKDRVTEIRDEEIRAAIRPAIEQAVNRPIHKTNTWGEPTGQQTTLSEVIVDEARKFMNEPADKYRREGGTVLQTLVRDEVHKAFSAEIADAVKQARDLVATQLGDKVSDQITAAVRAGLMAK
ncbi:hypothetical protein [Streptomyces acidiscabies]|uniref:Uncharacterized protein n=1 Tax=Streptomyces acidiscabies TaxID=42234 RepID=A0AAP6BKT0_9ACTN|nr:hypothetical protein [Streptomyces acidiscabies]MBZ3909396.1 hypothetical protein [Streptomyces acidiscabies]MDX2966626.1 hypothetical protein [Streptomyces acidiscabies]MDX3796596.1 hypothetical protein [Streptomyces acidiscabies]